jgi:Rieske Fe-S protein
MSEHPTPPSPERRRFLKWLTNGLGALFGVGFGIPAVAYLIDPRNRKAQPRGFKRAGRLSELKKDLPQQVVLRDIRRDAWTMYPNDVIGRVWLVRTDDKETAPLVFTTVCPHLGCSVNYDVGRQRFICPCHNGTFLLNGEKDPAIANNPPPRGMDTLEVKLVEDKDSPAGKKDYFIEVKYENFEQAKEEKIVKK